MPTASGQLQLGDYDAALVARGFDGFQPSERTQMINFAYRYIARKFPLTWEESKGTYTVNPGVATIPVMGNAPLTANSVIGVNVVSDPYRRKLEVATEQHFRRRWLYQDLTAAANRGIPTRYFVWESLLYVLPPPQLALSFDVFFYQYLLDMVASTDTPVTPQIFDEMIFDAALVRAHRRAHELQLALEAQGRVDEAIADMLQSDVWQMEELQERVLPDDQWL